MTTLATAAMVDGVNDAFVVDSNRSNLHKTVYRTMHSGNAITCSTPRGSGDNEMQVYISQGREERWRFDGIFCSEAMWRRALAVMNDHLQEHFDFESSAKLRFSFQFLLIRCQATELRAFFHGWPHDLQATRRGLCQDIKVDLTLFDKPLSDLQDILSAPHVDSLSISAESYVLLPNIATSTTLRQLELTVRIGFSGIPAHFIWEGIINVVEVSRSLRTIKVSAWRMRYQWPKLRYQRDHLKRALKNSTILEHFFVNNTKGRNGSVLEYWNSLQDEIATATAQVRAHKSNWKDVPCGALPHVVSLVNTLPCLNVVDAWQPSKVHGTIRRTVLFDLVRSTLVPAMCGGSHGYNSAVTFKRPGSKSFK